ncbi:MAG TPA: hypothetical protein VH575_03865 [Gemmataceae bacterium]|jgi:hypothetical protein
MTAPIGEPDDYDAERALPWTLFEPPEPEQAESRETMIAAAVQRPGGFVVVVLRALSAELT